LSNNFFFKRPSPCSIIIEYLKGYHFKCIWISFYLFAFYKYFWNIKKFKTNLFKPI